MSFLDTFRRMFSRKESQTRSLIVVNQVGRPVGTPRRYDKFAEEGYQKNVVVYACANLIANACAQIPFLLYQKPTGRKGKKVEIEQHPFFDLTDRPNPYMSATEFRVATVLYRLLSGNAYWQAVGPNPSTIAELHLWRPDRTKVIPGANGYPQAYRYEVNGRAIDVPVDFVTGRSPILHLKRFHPLNDFYGLANIEPAVLGIDQHNEASKWNLALLENAGMPSGVVYAEASPLNPTAAISTEQRAALKQDIKESFSGAKNAGKIPLLEGGLKWEQLSLSPKDMDWLNAKDTSARDIARAFGVPPMLLGIPGDNTYSNYEQANMAFYEQTVLPELKYLASWLQLWLIPTLDPKRAGQILVDFDTDCIDALAPKRKMIWDQTEKATWLTENEKRERTGYSPVDGADEILVPAGMVPLSMAVDPGMPTEQPPGSQNPSENDPNEPEDPTETQNDPPGSDQVGAAGGGKAAKALNLKSVQLKERYWLEMNRAQMRFEKRLKGQLGALFRVQGQDVAAAVKAASAQEIEHAAFSAVDGHRAKFRLLLEAFLIQVGDEFGARTIDALLPPGKTATAAIEKKDVSIRFRSNFKDWAHQHAGDKIEEITQATKKKVKRAVEDWQESGEPVTKLTDDLEALHEDFAGPRAEGIAITEVHTASTRAALKGAEDTGIPNLRKEWIFTNDSRTREAHRLSAKEAVVDLDEKFNVGGEELDAPGDPAGSPENIIRCRCTVAFLTEGE